MDARRPRPALRADVQRLGRHLAHPAQRRPAEKSAGCRARPHTGLRLVEGRQTVRVRARPGEQGCRLDHRFPVEPHEEVVAVALRELTWGEGVLGLPKSIPLSRINVLRTQPASGCVANAALGTRIPHTLFEQRSGLAR